VASLLCYPVKVFMEGSIEHLVIEGKASAVSMSCERSHQMAEYETTSVVLVDAGGASAPHMEFHTFYVKGCAQHGSNPFVSHYCAFTFVGSVYSELFRDEPCTGGQSF